MLVLGLDPSLTSYGWALHETTAQGQARCVSRGCHQTPSKMLEILRYMKHRDHVESLVRSLKPDRVAIEYPIFNELYSSGMYGLFLFTFEALLRSRADVVFLSNSSTKALVRRFLDRPKGWGQITKQDMIDAAKRDVSRGRWKSDEADAYWVAVLGGRFWEFFVGNLTEDDLSDYERTLFTEIKRPLRGKMAGRTVEKGLLYRQNDRFFLLSQL